MAFNCDHISVEAITVVSGACTASRGVQNVAHLLGMIGIHLPVYSGRQTPLLGPLRDSTHIMGSDGLGGFNFPHIDQATDSLLACDAIRKFIRDNPHENIIVCLGPLTNIAFAFLTDPDLVPLVGRLVIMGGVSDGVGNITPTAEFNIWADPEAACAVFESGVHYDLVGWDVSRHDDCNFSNENL